jgi:IS30 family transposase
MINKKSSEQSDKRGAAYHRFTNQEREILMLWRESGHTQKKIALALGRSPSTICRELGRTGSGVYSACFASVDAQKNKQLRRNPVRLMVNQNLQNAVCHRLTCLGYSPQQVASRLKKEYPSDTSMHISTESIYQYIYIHAKGELKKELLKSLRRVRTGRTSRGKPALLTGKIPNMTLITERPAEVENRSIPGHWEGDLIIGKDHKSALGVLVERSLKYTMVIPLKYLTSAYVAMQFAKAFQSIPQDLKKTLTYDQGREMIYHEDFTKITNLKVYFAHPHSPWEKGTVENTNGLIRQYFPKGTDFRTIKKEEIAHVQFLLNNRPRKALDWDTPAERFINFQLR